MILEEGDTVVFYTDGIIEAKNTNNEFFGEDRLTDSILQNKDKSASKISQIIMERLICFTGGMIIDDDVTIVAIGR